MSADDQIPFSANDAVGSVLKWKPGLNVLTRVKLLSNILCRVLFGATLLPAALPARADGPLVDELKHSVTREHARFLAVIDRSDVAYSETVHGVSESGEPYGPTQRIRVVSSNPAVGGTRITSTDVKSGGSAIVCANPQYAFDVLQNSANAVPYMGSYTKNSPQPVRDRYVRAGFGETDGGVVEFMNSEFVRSQSVEEITTDGYRYVVARFTRTFKDYVKPLPLWIMFDPEQDWRVVQYAEHYSWGVTNVRIRYQSGIDGILFPAEIAESEHAYYAKKWTETLVQLELPVPCQLQAKAFTLNAYGLGVPADPAAATASTSHPAGQTTTEAGPANVTPPAAAEASRTNGRFYLILVIAAAGVALIAAAILRRKPSAD